MLFLQAIFKTMKLYWTMPKGIKEHYRRELKLYETEFA